jgi:adenylate cyclase
MTSNEPPGRESEEFWRDFLSGGHSKERVGRRIFKLIPHAPRCRLCAAPFAGAGAPLMRLIGKTPSDKNPNWCNSCFVFMSDHHGGAEIEVTMLFADVRGSTTLAESMPSADFRVLMDRFYDTAATVIFDNDGIVDKFVGDELVSMFFPLLSGERHAARAVDAARALLEATGHADPGGPWVPVGAGVHTGVAWVGAVGSGTRTELTALGDAVNTTARLASAARAGEILVTAEAAAAAGLDASLERRPLELRGKKERTEVVALAVSPTAAAGDYEATLPR